MTRKPIVLIGVLTFLLLSKAAFAMTDVQIDVSGTNEYHVFVPGESFQFEVTPRVISGDIVDLSYQWVDYQGNALTSAQPMAANQTNTIASPQSTMETGYYGLKFLGDDVEFNVESSHRDELGFAVLPEIIDRTVDESSPFGLVQHDHFDPYLNPGWIKSRVSVHARDTVNNVVDPDSWRAQISERLEQGQLEVPLVVDDPWDTDDSSRVSTGQLNEIQSMMAQYFAAEDRVPAWELGIEEQLSHDLDDDVFYFDNLEKKFQVISDARDNVHPNGDGPLLGYQVVNYNETWLEALFSHPAGDLVDVLAIHPYAWPDFPDPETWHADRMAELRSIMEQHSKSLPVWYTEGGAPQNDAEVDQMLSGSSPVTALTRAEFPRYLVKLHMLAFAEGVERFFWYNYKDRDTELDDVEAHFGLLDFWDFPKPGYAAYANMVNTLRGKRLVRSQARRSGLRVFRFSNRREFVTVAWMPVGQSRRVRLQHLRTPKANVIAATNVVGSPIPFVGRDGERIKVGEDPIFLRARTPRAAAELASE